MKAIILAAGEGRRMRPLTLETPKPLLRVGDKSILEHIVSRLPDDVNELVLVIGYMGERIKDYCGDNFLGKKTQYVLQEKPLGTYHALKLCESLIGKNERFFVLCADDIHGKKGMDECLKHNYALLVAEVEDPRKFGVVRLNSDNSIAEIEEKPENPSSNVVSTGVLLLDSEIFKYEADVHPNGEYYLTDALSKMMKDGHKIFGVKSTIWLPIGYPEDIKKAEEILRERGEI
ncbi:MAG: nucleotidyltransferase family protein [Candidatus Paceibacterota bacterium]